MTLGERIKEVRRLYKQTQEEFGKSIDVRRNTVAMYEADAIVPSDRVLKSICREYNMSFDWIKSETGEMLRTTSTKEMLGKLISDALSEEPDSFKLQLLAVLSRLSPEQWQVLSDVAQMLREEQDRENS